MSKRHFTKNKYSTNAAKKREEADLDAEARRAWARAREEHDRYIGLLEDVDIDEYADEDYLSSQTKITLRKLIVPSKKKGLMLWLILLADICVYRLGGRTFF